MQRRGSTFAQTIIYVCMYIYIDDIMYNYVIVRRLDEENSHEVIGINYIRIRIYIYIYILICRRMSV